MGTLLIFRVLLLPMIVSSNFFPIPVDAVLTLNGLVIGTREHTVQNRDTYYAYKGVPYAKPPIGNLRFEPPQPIGKWLGILDATKERDVCSQITTTSVKTSKIRGSEDCLYLNIYTPLSSRDVAQKQPPLAVMVWIHGGGFFEGDDQYELYAPDFLLEENVVVVTVAYRLGIFGFYSTGDLTAPGNYGLKDQILALRWVKNNIKNFGGDPDRITIFGESAGALSVSFLTQTPLTQGLYQNAIMQSGLSHCFGGLSTTATELAYATAQLLNINFTTHQDLKNKLKSVDYKLVLTMSSLAQVRIYGSNPISFGVPMAPVIEPDHVGAVVKRSTYETMITGDFNLTPLLMGINSMEGVAFALNPFLSGYLDAVKLASEKLVPGFFYLQDPAILKEVGDQIKAYYFDSVDATKFDNEQLFAYSSDFFFIANILEAARISANFTDIFFYRLSHLGELGDPQRPSTSGVGHAEDLNYLFNRLTSPQNPSSSDLMTRARMVRMWTNFAKTANPTPEVDSLLQDVIWKKMDEDFNYLNIGDDLTTGVNPQEEIFQFWMNLLDEYKVI